MTVREFAMAGCKILGLFFMVKAVGPLLVGIVISIIHFPLLSLMFKMAPQSDAFVLNSDTFGIAMLGPIYSSLMLPVVELWLGFMIWRKAEAIAARITRNTA